MKRWQPWLAAFCLAMCWGVWAERSPHWVFVLAPLGYALVAGRRSWVGYAVAGAYVALWVAVPVQSHRSFQVAVLKVPGLDCAQFDRCSAGAVEMSLRLYGDRVSP